jgi:ABC-type amino acid transport substrate-binding protein
MNMKKVFQSILAAFCILSLAACGSSSASSSSSTSASSAASSAAASQAADTTASATSLPMADLDLSNADGVLKDVLDKGVLVVATSPDYPPNEYIDSETGEVKGSEMVLAQYIADNLGVELKIETMDFSGVLTALDTGKADLAISGFGYKKDRAENYELSIGYQGTSEASCHTLLVPADTASSYTTLEDFSGKTIDAQASSLQEMYVEDEIPDANLQLVATIDQAILDLNTGKVDAVALDCTTAKNYAAQSDGTLVKSDVEFDLTPYEDYAGNVMAVKKGETSMIEAINAIITVVNDNELYTDWYNQAKEEAGVTE